MNEPTVDDVLAAWRDDLPLADRREHAAFMSRRGPEVRAVVEAWLARRHARAGGRPETEQEFAAYDALLSEQRQLDALGDTEIASRALELSKQLAAAGVHPHYARVSCAQEFAKTRAEAIYLRGTHYIRAADLEVVPFLLTRPALVVCHQSRTVAVRDWHGVTQFRQPEKYHGQGLHVLFESAQDDIERLWARLDTWTTDENIMENSRRLWSAARAGERATDAEEVDPDEERRQHVERLDSTLLHARRPVSRGAWLVFWDLPWLAIKGPLVGADRATTVEAMGRAGFAWSEELKRYQRRPEEWGQGEAWVSAQEVVESLTPAGEWETPTDRELLHISKLPEGSNGWAGQGGPKWKGNTDGTIS